MKNILFPFYTNKHNFLKSKKWFNIISILYPVFLLSIFIHLYHLVVTVDLSDCYNFTKTFYAVDTVEFYRSIETCRKLYYSYLLQFGIIGPVSILIVHYIIQFVFFRMVINTIVTKKEPRNVAQDDNAQKSENKRKSTYLKKLFSIIVVTLIFSFAFYLVPIIVGFLTLFALLALHVDPAASAAYADSLKNTSYLVMLIILIKKIITISKS